MKLYLKKFLKFLKNNIYRLFFAEITWSKKEYKDWEEALKDSRGYNDKIIIDKVYEAALQVINGNASFERDGAIFKNKEYCYEILSSFLYYINNQKKIKVADIGGSLGSMYFQYKEILEEKTEILCWEIFEQENFVKKGNQSFRDKNLMFSEIKNIKNNDNYDIAIFGSVLNYLQHYPNIFNEFCKKSNCIIVDRTSFDLEKKIRVLLADDHAVVRMGFRLLLQDTSDMEVTGEAESGEEVLKEIGKKQVDVLVMDLSMPGIGGLETISRVNTKPNPPKILILSAHCALYSKDAVEILLNTMDRFDAGGVFGRQIPTKKSNPIDIRDLLTVFGRERIIYEKFPFFHNAFSLIKKSIWLNTKFDENVNGIEDRFWASKICQTGEKIVYEPSAVAYHEHGLNQSSNIKRASRVCKALSQLHKDDIIEFPKEIF